MLSPHPDAKEATQDFIEEIRKAVPHVAFDHMTRTLYSTDASIYQMMPVGVAFPKNADEAQGAVEIAGRHRIPLLARGGGSSLAGQAIGHAMILDMSRYMDQVLEINQEEKWVRTQPGITLGALNKILAGQGLMYGPDPASADRATIGGIVGNNSTGAHSIVYGMTSDHVLAAEVILSDGHKIKVSEINASWESLSERSGIEGEAYRAIPKIIQKYRSEIQARYPKTFRHVAGYNLHYLERAHKPNLTPLLVGSEGTLGVTTETTLNLVPVPRKTRLAMVHFSELRAAMEAVPVLLESQPTAVEVLDKMLLDLTRDRVEYRRLLTFVEGDPAVILVVEYSGESESELDAGIDRLKSKLGQIGHKDSLVIVSDQVGQANVWYVRKVGLGILMSVKGDAKPIPFIEDAAVPVEHLADYITQIYDFARTTGVERVAMYAHASAGCLHVRPLVNLKKGAGVRQLRQIAEKSVELVVKYGGTTSGEHGDGMVRAEFLEQLFGAKIVQAFKEVKAAFDPHNLLNPGKVVNPPQMDDQSLMRYGTGYETPYQLQSPVYSYQREGGFARAVEMCNGAGVCRKHGIGVMCPSFQATKDEAHSTRGRANALRAAITGGFGASGMNSKEVYDVLDLCLSCQACKSECPSGVDMAKLKSEFLQHYFDQNGTPLKNRIFGNIATLNHLAQPIAGIANLALKGPGKWVLNSLGVHPKRELPQFAPQSFSAWFSQRPQPLKSDKSVVFFHDTFIEHNHPQIGKSAVKVLEAIGYQVILLEKRKCCGRPAVSKGLLRQAKKLAEYNVELFAPFAQQGIPIVGCEPSCLAMFGSEYLDLVPGPVAESVAEMVMGIDQFIVQEIQDNDINLAFEGNDRKILFHGHCHQKANFGTAATRQMLELIPGITVDEVDSGCCGMAGSFGYEKEHYDLSIKLAEMSLAPAVRHADTETIICATGTSCREQIAHTTERIGVHPVEIFANALK